MDVLAVILRMRDVSLKSLLSRKKSANGRKIKMPELYCHTGDHNWFRESQRGRKPENCPAHQPTKDIKITSKPVEKEKTVFDIIPGLQEIVEQEKIQTLMCEFPAEEHEWQRKSRRGKPPRYCEKHSALIKSSSANLPAVALSSKASETIEQILSLPSAASCRCKLSPSSSPAEIRALGAGCGRPWFICGTLDSVRRTLNL